MCVCVHSSGAQGQPALHSYHIVPKCSTVSTVEKEAKSGTSSEISPGSLAFALMFLRGVCGLTLYSSQFAVTQLGGIYCHTFLTPCIGFRHGPAPVTHFWPH